MNFPLFARTFMSSMGSGNDTKPPSSIMAW